MKKLLMLASIAALISPAAAQEPPKKGPDAYTLTLTPQEVNAVGIALMQRPYSEVADLMNKLNDQVKKQNDAASGEPAKPSTPPPAPNKK